MHERFYGLLLLLRRHPREHVWHHRPRLGNLWIAEVFAQILMPDPAADLIQNRRLLAEQMRLKRGVGLVTARAIQFTKQKPALLRIGCSLPRDARNNWPGRGLRGIGCSERK